MTTKELITILAAFPPSTKVYQSADAEGNGYMPVDDAVKTAPGVVIIYPAHQYVEDEDELFDDTTAVARLNAPLPSNIT